MFIQRLLNKCTSNNWLNNNILLQVVVSSVYGPWLLEQQTKKYQLKFFLSSSMYSQIKGWVFSILSYKKLFQKNIELKCRHMRALGIYIWLKLAH